MLDADTPLLVNLVDTQRYFRAGAYGTNGIFAARSLVHMSVTGPLQANFDLASAGMPDGIFPPVRQKPYFDAALSLPGLTLPVRLRVRGNSSLQECPFPKLKFKVAPEHRTNTPFAEAREVKLGTHCAEGGRGNIGRLREQAAVFREVLAYELLEQMGFLAPRVRRALVDYHDTTAPTNSTATTGWQVTRDAMLLEDIEIVAARVGGRVLADAEVAALPVGSFDAQIAADLQVFYALIGNWDYALAWDTRGVWNTDVLELRDGAKTKLVPVAGDFDLSSWVTGVARRIAPRDYHPELGDIEREMLYGLETAQQRVGAAVFNVARERFARSRPTIESRVTASKVDQEGLANALRHVAAFYQALVALP